MGHNIESMSIYYQKTTRYFILAIYIRSVLSTLSDAFLYSHPPNFQYAYSYNKVLLIS